MAVFTSARFFMVLVARRHRRSARAVYRILQQSRISSRCKTERSVAPEDRYDRDSDGCGFKHFKGIQYGVVLGGLTMLLSRARADVSCGGHRAVVLPA